MRNMTVILITALFSAALLGCNDTAKPVKVERLSNVPSVPVSSTDADGHEDTAQRIELVDAKTAFDKGEAVFIDTREAVYFAKESIKGSINIPAADLDKEFNKIPKGKKIIAYCS